MNQGPSALQSSSLDHSAITPRYDTSLSTSIIQLFLSPQKMSHLKNIADDGIWTKYLLLYRVAPWTTRPHHLGIKLVFEHSILYSYSYSQKRNKTKTKKKKKKKRNPIYAHKKMVHLKKNIDGDGTSSWYLLLGYSTFVVSNVFTYYIQLFINLSCW